jgi:dynein heavy chain
MTFKTVFTRSLLIVFKTQDVPENEYMETPLILSHFADGIGDQKYMFVKTWASLEKLLNDAMDSYEELMGAMSLVLFKDAMAHVCRINRILELPRGNALLVGVGGSGKQSLARLAAFISAIETFQLQLKSSYSIADLKVDLAGLYLKAGLKNAGIMFLMTDSQVADEKFLVLINDMLASGQIPDLFADDEVDNIIQAIGPEVHVHVDIYTRGGGIDLHFSMYHARQIPT